MEETSELMKKMLNYHKSYKMLNKTLPLERRKHACNKRHKLNKLCKWVLLRLFTASDLTVDCITIAIFSIFFCHGAWLLLCFLCTPFSPACYWVSVFRPLSDSSRVSTPCSIRIDPIPSLCPQGADEICQSGHDHLYSTDAHQMFDPQNTTNPPQVIVIGIVNTKTKQHCGLLGTRSSEEKSTRHFIKLQKLVNAFIFTFSTFDISEMLSKQT